jgi:hypothetical protein
MPKTELLTTAAMNLIPMPTRMTPIERSLGRFMRAPDGHEGGDGDSDGGGDATPVDDASKPGEGDDGADEGGKTALGDAGDEADADDGAGGVEEDADGKKKDGDAGDGEDGPPEAYELKLTVTEKDAEGKDVETQVDMDPVLVEKATPFLKELNLSNEQANKLVGLVPQIQARMLEQQNDQFAAMRADWLKEAKADPEVGGKNWTKSLNLAAKALDHLGFPKGSEFRALLDETGIGNRKELVQAFSKVGAMIKEDDLVRGDKNPAGKKDRLEELYPDDVPNTDKK